MSASWKRGPFGLAALALAAALSVLAGCGTEPPVWSPDKSPRVAASFPPLYCFAKNVAGDPAEVLCLLKDQGPHGYQYNPRDMLLLREADVFFANGLGLDDHFTNPMANNCGNPRLRYVKLAEAVPADKRLGMKEEDHAHHGHHHHHAHGGDSSDPHVWLGIDEAVLMVEAVRKELSAKDPERAADYQRRADEYTRKLRKLHEECKQKLAGRKVNLVTAHESMAYFARSFGLNVVGSIQFHPGSDPSSARIAELAKECAKHNVRVIAVEPQYPDATAQLLLNLLAERGVKAVKVTIDPLETAEVGDLDEGWYERKMRQNIDNLVEALK